MNAGEDKKRVELVTARNQGEALVHQTQKSLTEYGDKLEAGEKEKIESALKDLQATLAGEDKEAIEAKSNELMTASQKMGEKMYADMQAAQAAAGAAAGAGGEPGAASGAAGGAKPKDDDVVDADFKEVKRG
jgi:molecular chaperone DnaK